MGYAFVGVHGMTLSLHVATQNVDIQNFILYVWLLVQL